MNPRFSVIIPLYNKAPYVRKALDSVITQTFTDWECIIVDDGSTDNSLAICEETIIYHKSKIINIVRQNNSGVAVARNNGVKASHGEYLCFLDADDWWKDTYLEEMDRLIKEYPEAGLYATNYIYYKPGKTHVALKLDRGYMNYLEAYLYSTVMPVCTIATCMPRRIFDEMSGFPVGIKLGEDFLLWARTALHYKIAYCEKPLAYYNNDIPTSLRATRNLHAPEHHMLFHLNEIEREIERLSLINSLTPSLVMSWKGLLDKLRVSGLMDYWLDERYHDIAAAELAKVDWNKQPRKAKKQYEKPIWWLCAMRRFRNIGSYCKQKLIHLWVK